MLVYFSDDYKLLQTKHSIDLSTYFGTGTSNSIAAGRIAYFLGSEGPTMSVDTACSSSLVAVHLACQSLKTGDSSLALASGVNLLLSPELSISFSQANMLAPDGRCKTFDASANGYVRSEGCGVVVLKRLEDAQANGDNILGVIKGTAINQDGASNGLTAPNGLAQEAVIQRALDVAQIQPQDVSYVEAHGTGTPLGDPIEVNALEAVYGINRDDTNPLTVGSVKTNFGHTEGAAGIAGLMKVVLSLQHGYIPRHIFISKISTHIWLMQVSPSQIKVKIGNTLRTQTHDGQVLVRLALAELNAHVILEEAPAAQAQTKRLWRPYHLLTLSAQSENGLHELAQNYGPVLSTDEDELLPDIAHTTNVGRIHLSHRLSVVAATTEEAQSNLEMFTNGDESIGLSYGTVGEGRSNKMAFLFTGQGSQYIGMGRELYETQPLFRQRLNQCDVVLQECLGRSLIELLYPETSPEHNDLMESHPLWTSGQLRHRMCLGRPMAVLGS